MKKTMKALITFAMVAAVLFGTNLTTYAAGTQFIEGTIAVSTTPNGVTVYGCYYDDFPITMYTTEFPEEYLLAIDAAGITNEMSQYDKCVAINNYLCQVAEYGQSETTLQSIFNAGDTFSFDQLFLGLRNTSVSGVGLLKNGKAICSGYADAFQTMTSMLGIQSCTLHSYTLNHAWNAVIIDDVVYYVDVTWNDSTGTDNYLMSTVFWDDHWAEDIAAGNFIM